MANIKISEQKVLQIEAICKDFNNEKGELINVLHKTHMLHIRNIEWGLLY